MRLSERLQWARPITSPNRFTGRLRHRVRRLIQQSLLSKQLEVANRELERLASLVAGYGNEFAVNSGEFPV